MSVQSYESLKPCLEKSHLSDLKINEKNEIVVNDVKTEAIDPDVVDRVKSKFCELIQYKDDIDTKDIDKEIDFIEQRNKQLEFLRDLSKSPLFDELFTKDEFQNIINNIKEIYGKGLELSLYNFTQYAETPKVDLETIKKYREKLIKLNSAPLIDTVNLTLKEMELKEYFRKNSPDFFEKFSSLPEEDQHLLYTCLFNVSYLWLGKKNLEIFIELCTKINQVKDPTLKEQLKKYVFFPPSQNTMKIQFEELKDLVALASEANELKEFFSILDEMPLKSDEQKNNTLQWLPAILKDSIGEENSKKVVKLKDGILMLKKHLEQSKTVPLPINTVSAIKQLELSNAEPELYIKLLSINPNKDLMYYATLYPEEARVLLSCFAEQSKEQIDLFAKGFENLQFSHQRKLIQGLAKIPSQQRSDLLDQLTIWFDTTKNPLSSQAKDRCFYHKDMAQVIAQLAPLIKQYLKDENQIKSIFKTQNEELYNYVFEGKDSFEDWQHCERTLLESDGRLASAFDSWIDKISLGDRKKEESWSEYVLRTQSAFQQNLSLLFKIEKDDPMLFKQMLQIIITDNSSRSLNTLIKLYHNVDPEHLKDLLSIVQKDPTLLPCVESIMQANVYFINKVISHIKNLDFQTMSFLIREGVHFSKLSDMLGTIDKSLDTFKKIVKIETSSTIPLIWKQGEYYSYTRTREADLNILVNNLAIQEAFIKNGLSNGIPWTDIPTEIWSVDKDLPLKIYLLAKKYDADASKHNLFLGASKYNLFLGAIAEKQDALAYKLLKLEEQGLLDKSFLNLMCRAPAKDPTANALAAICLKDAQDLKGTLPFLKEKEWKSFETALECLEKHYDLSPDGSIEERLQRLPIRWKYSIAKLITLGLENKTFIESLCQLILKHPQVPFIDKFLDTMNSRDLSTRPDKNLIELFINLPARDLSIPKDFDPFHLFQLISQFSKQCPNQDLSTILPYLISLPTASVRQAVSFLTKTPNLFVPMIELDKKLGSNGGIIQEKFSEDTRILIADNLEFFRKALKQIRFTSYNEAAHKELGPLYLQMLEAVGENEGIAKLVGHKDCLEAFKKVDFKRLTHPNKFMSHIVTIASRDQLDELYKILKWMEKNDYSRTEALLDMAIAGYIPEVITVLSELEKNPTNEKYLNILQKAGSVNAADIQKELSGITEKKSEESFKLKTDDQAFEKVKSHMKEFLEVSLKDVVEKDFKERAIETEFSRAIAESLLASGELKTIPRDQVEQLFDAVGIPKNSDFAIYFLETLSALQKDPRFAEILSQVTISKDKNSPAVQIVRRMLNMKIDDVVEDRHAQVATLSALLSRVRQSKGVGSCFGTSSSIITQSHREGLIASLKDYQSILSDNALTRTTYGKHSGTHSYPGSLLTKKMKLPILNENLLLKVRETAIAGMSSTERKEKESRATEGLMTENLNLFDEGKYYDEKLKSFNNELIPTKVPIESKVILEAFRKSYRDLVKAVIEYEEEHPISKNLGWTHLARRDKEENISTLSDYQKLHKYMLLNTYETLSKQKEYEPAQKYLSALFDDLIQKSQKEDSVKEMKYMTDPDSKSNNLWRTDWGGSDTAVMTVNLQFAGESIPLNTIYSQNPEQTLGLLMDACDAFPENEKESFIKEPEKLTYLCVPWHALCFKPFSLIKQLKEGKSTQDLVENLMKPSNIRIDSFDKGEREKWMKEFIEKTLPKSIQKPFEKAIASLKWEEMTVEDCGQAMMGIFLDVHKLEPDVNTLRLMERYFFKLFPSDVIKNIPIEIIGDLNWDNEGYNNCYLGCARSPLTGKLSWYVCQRDGTERRGLHWEVSNGKWSIMSPVSRRENGFLSYKSLEKTV